MSSVLSYIGGKHRVASFIVSLIPEHRTYTEPFAGGAQVFFRKSPSKVEVLNDLNNDVVNFFRICQNHYDELLRYLRFTLVSRHWYDLFAKTPPETMTDIQRAARFLYLQKNSYAGRVIRQNLRYSIVQPPSYRADTIEALIRKTHERLQGVQIECLPYEQVLKKYDSEKTFHFLDPPYWERKLYAFNFTRTDFEQLADRLTSIQGKFLMTLDDRPEIRQIFSAFQFRAFQISYSSQRKSGRKFNEVLISNFDLPKAST